MAPTMPRSLPLNPIERTVPDSPPSPPLCHFVLRHVVPAGTRVGVLGNAPPLGEWDAKRVLLLRETEPGLWHAALPLQPEPIEYKYVLVGSDGVTSWERNGRDNRRRDASQGDAIVEEVWEA